MDSFVAHRLISRGSKGIHKITHIGISNLQPQRGEPITTKKRP